MYKTLHTLLTGLLMLLCTAVSGQDHLIGLFQSPRGVGVCAFLDDPDGQETNIITARTDFYGFLSGRTQDVGAAVSYTHDYYFYRRETDQFSLRLHAGAGGMSGYTHDFETGFFSAFDRQLVRPLGWTVALVGNFGVRMDFRRHLSLDVSLSTLPGIHLRTDSKTGTLLVAFYKAGVYHSFYPQVNLMYRF